MFSDKDFIKASRKFVCVRLESYESEEHQKMVRSFLNGRFENTAFCLLAPDGEERLSRSGRAPWMAFADRRGPRGGGGHQEDPAATIAAMEKVANKYPRKGDPGTPVVQDFHSFRQALNVASGDQRLLLFVAAPENRQHPLRETLRPVFGDEAIIGRFHADFYSKGADDEWFAAIEGAKPEAGLFIIRSDEFGQAGKVMNRLPLETPPDQIKSALLAANESFARDEERKVYRDHVAQGRREQIHFENAMPYGEDRDGDGKIDHRGGMQRGAGPGGRPRGGSGPPPRTRP